MPKVQVPALVTRLPAVPAIRIVPSDEPSETTENNGEAEFIVCDESVAALDVSIQAQVLNLFMDLKTALNLTYLFISHDLLTVSSLCHRIAILRSGELVEVGLTNEILTRPAHPYTKQLVSALPVPEALTAR